MQKGLLLSAILLLTSTQSIAQTEYEITPFAGYRFGGDFDVSINGDTSSLNLDDQSSYGVVFAWPFDQSRQGEILFSHNKTPFEKQAAIDTELSVSYLHLGGNVPLTTGDIPILLSGGIGATFFSPSNDTYDSETKLSGNLGLSTKVKLADNLNFVFGGRVYATLFNNEGEFLCNESECSLSVTGDLWIQSEVYSGISFTF
ncbi:outer membrane beta-barrel protein [Thalassotalea fusca]